jgi:uncharacterized YccA/Bax inhibitor family protein
MESRNPVFGRSEQFKRGGYATFDTRTPSAGDLQDMYEAPSATAVDRGRMTIDDVVMRTATLFGILVVAAAATFFPIYNRVADTNAVPSWTLPAVIGGAIIGLVLSLIINFSKTIKPGLMMAYAVAEGVFVGAISALFEIQFEGIVAQAVLGTLATFTGMLVLYKTGVIRATPKFTKILIMAGFGYMLFSLVNIGFAIFGGTSVYDMGALGLAVSAFGVGLAALFLVLDFDFVEQGIKNGLPRQYAWTAAFGLVTTLVWLYIEILRLLAILRGDN